MSIFNLYIDEWKCVWGGGVCKNKEKKKTEAMNLREVHGDDWRK